MNKLKPVMKTSTIELPGGFILQHQEPDGENYYTEQMMDEAIKEISEPYFKAERQRLIEEVRKLVDGMRKNTTLSHACLQSWGGCDCNDNKNYNQALDDLLQELNKLKGIK